MKVCINLLILILVGGSASQLLPGLNIPVLPQDCANILNQPCGSCRAPPVSGKTLTVDCPRGVEPKETKKFGNSSEQIATMEGYKPETHNVSSQGYTIGMGDHDWFTGYSKTSLPFKTSDKGCDTWVVSLRGTIRSSTYDQTVTKKAQYNFTLDDMAKDDMPAIIDYIKNKTGCTKFNLFGLSLGGAVITAFLAEHPSYKDLICSASLMGPGMYIRGMTNPILNTLACLIANNPALRNANALLFDQLVSAPIFAFMKYVTTNCVNNNLNATACGITLNTLFGTCDHKLNITSDNNVAMAVSNDQLFNWITYKTMIHLFDQRTTEPVNTFCKYNPIRNAPCDPYKMTNIDTTNTTINVHYGGCDPIAVTGSADAALSAAVPGVNNFYWEGLNHIDPTYQIGLGCYNDKMIANIPSRCICS